MSGVPAAAVDLDALRADYVSARFVQMVTFRGCTLDSVAIADTVAGTYRLSHTPDAMVVQWWPETSRPIERQVRVVPWSNVCCCEPSSPMLARVVEAHEVARTRPLKPRPNGRS